MRVLILQLTPKFALEADIGDRLRRLSEAGLSGVFLTLSTLGAQERFGAFDVVCVPTAGQNTVVVMLRALSAARGLMSDAPGFSLIVSLDPLKSGLLGAFLAWRHRLPHVCEVNGTFTNRETYSQSDVWWRRPLYLAVQRFVLSRCEGVRLLYADQLTGSGVRLKDRRSIVLHDFTKTSLFHDAGEEPVVLFVGYPYRLKGVDVLVDAFKSIVDEHPDWELHLIGWLDEDRDALLARIGDERRIRYLGTRPHHEVVTAVARCGVLVLPSRSEGMGRVLIEAMAASKPVVGSRVGGIPTVVSDTVNGLLVEPGDVTGLAMALSSLMGSRALREKLGSAGAHLAATRFSERSYAVETARFYRSVVNDE